MEGKANPRVRENDASQHTAADKRRAKKKEEACVKVKAATEIYPNSPQWKERKRDRLGISSSPASAEVSSNSKGSNADDIGERNQESGKTDKIMHLGEEGVVVDNRENEELQLKQPVMSKEINDFEWELEEPKRLLLQEQMSTEREKNSSKEADVKTCNLREAKENSRELYSAEDSEVSQRRKAEESTSHKTEFTSLNDEEAASTYDVAPQTEQQYEGERGSFGEQLSILSKENNQFSLQSDIQLIKENADLLMKKFKMETLVQKADVVLAAMKELPQLSQVSKEKEFSFNDACRLPSKTSPAQISRSIQVADETNDESSEGNTTLEMLYEQADAITHKAALLAEVLHDNRDPSSDKSVLNHDEIRQLVPEPEFEVYPSSKCNSQKQITSSKELGDSPSNKDEIALPLVLKDSKEGTQLRQGAEETETYEEKLDVQSLLQKAKLLIEKVKGRGWNPDMTDKNMEIRTEAGNSSQESQRNDKTNIEHSQKTDKGETKMSEIEQEIHNSGDKMILPKASKKELSTESTTAINEISLQRATEFPANKTKMGMETVISGLDELVKEESISNEESKKHHTHEENEMPQENPPWSVIQTTLLLEKNELDLLRFKTQLLQQKAEMILSRKQLTENKTVLQQQSLQPLESESAEESIDNNKETLEFDKDNEGQSTSNMTTTEQKTCMLHENKRAPSPDRATGNQDMESKSEEEAESTDEDDPSFDSKAELQLLLQRAKLVLFRASVPLSQRQQFRDESICSTVGDASSDVKNCSSQLEAEVSVKAAKKELIYEHNPLKLKQLDGEYESLNAPPRDKTNTNCPTDSELFNKTKTKTKLSKPKLESGQGEINRKDISQDAELELLLEKTKELQHITDSLLNQTKVPEIKSDQESEGSTSQQRENQDLQNKIHTKLTTNNELQDIGNTEKAKRPTEINLDKRTTLEQKFKGLNVEEIKAELKESQQESEHLQLEYEEIEESQLEINEIETSQFEIEEDYLSDESEMSDMMRYYEDGEISQEEADKLDETKSNQTKKVELQQLHELTDEPNGSQPFQVQQTTELTGLPGTTEDKHELKQLQDDLSSENKEPFDERKELLILLDKTKLLLDMAKLPLTTATVPSIPRLSMEELVLPELPLAKNISNQKSKNSEASLIKNKAEKSDQDSAKISMSNEVYQLEKSESECHQINVPSNKTIPAKSDKLHSNSNQPAEKSEKGEHLEKTEILFEKISDAIHEPIEMEQTECRTKKLHNLEWEEADFLAKNNETALNCEKSSEKVLLSSELSPNLLQLKTEVTSLLKGHSDLEATPGNEELLDNSANQGHPEHDKLTSAQPSNDVADHASGSRTSVRSEGASEITERDLTAEAKKTEEGKCTGLRNWNSMTNLTLLLKLQKEMCKMQLQMSNLQDAMRATTSTLQELMDEAFSEI